MPALVTLACVSWMPLGGLQRELEAADARADQNSTAASLLRSFVAHCSCALDRTGHRHNEEDKLVANKFLTEDRNSARRRWRPEAESAETREQRETCDMSKDKGKASSQEHSQKNMDWTCEFKGSLTSHKEEQPNAQRSQRVAATRLNLQSTDTITDS